MGEIYGLAQDLGLVTESEGSYGAREGAKLKALREEMLLRINQVAERADISAKQLGKIERGEVDNPDTVTIGKAYRALESFRVEAEGPEAGPTAYATGEGQVTIVAEGVFGIEKLTVSGSPSSAEAAMAKLIEDIRRGDASNQP